MKTIGKILAILLATLMVMGSSVVAFADDSASGSITISISNDEDLAANISGETYTAYKMLSLKYTAPNGYLYYLADGEDDAWYGFFTSDEAKSIFDISEDYIVSLKDDDAADIVELSSEEIMNLSKSALQYATDNDILGSGSVTIGDNSAGKIDNLSAGWYLVSSSLGYLNSIVTVINGESSAIYEKNLQPGLIKEDQTDDGYWGSQDDWSVGDEVPYEVYITNIAGIKNVALHDQIGDGLDFTEEEANSIKVYYYTGEYDNPDEIENWEELSTNYYSVYATVLENTNDSYDDKDTFEIVFSDDWTQTATANTVIKVTYGAMLNEYAVENAGDHVENHAILTAGAGFRVTSETDTYLFSFDIFKYTEGIEEGQTPLAGAEFTLQRGNVEDYAYFSTWTNNNGDKEYVVEGWTDTIMEDISSDYTYYLISDDNGMIHVDGLADNTYVLTETKAPTGYNLLQSPIQVVLTAEINEDGTYTGNSSISIDGNTVEQVEVLNNVGNELPGTGGMGTTIFYFIGGVLVLGVVVIAVTRYRMKKNSESD